MNSIGCGRKQLWPKFEALSQNFPGGTKENHEKSVRAVGVWGDT
jgi:hypothetical protein